MTSPVGRRLARVIQLQTARPARRRRSPASVLLLGFLLLIAIGTVVLTLPVASAAGTWTDPLTALFTATSAVCVTGLVVVDTATHWSAFGQVAILVMIQVGGFGFMTGSTLLLFILIGRRTGLRDRMLVQASTGEPELGGVTALLRRVAAFTVAVEAAGALILFVGFLTAGRSPGEAAWWGAFHSVSAFNNAGFDLTGGFASLAGFADDVLVLAPVAILIILGGLGYAIVGDIALKRRWRRLAVETKLVVVTTLVLIPVGAVAIAVIEWSNPATLGAFPPLQRPFNALFESIAFRTGGFTSIALGSMAESALFVGIILMFIGGASGSTAGGIKITTFATLLVAIIATVRGRPAVVAFGRRLPDVLVYRALSVALLAIALVLATSFLLELLAPAASFSQILFEAVSAFGTVGAGTGLTPTLPDAALVVLIVAMYVGRLGPLTFVLAMTARARPVAATPAVEVVRIG